MTTFGTPPDDPQPPQPVPAEPPPTATPSPTRMLSPDGRWVWNGTRWEPAPGAQLPPPPMGYHPGSPSPLSLYGAAAVAVVTCPSCGQAFGPGFTCQACGQVSNLPPGVRLSSVGRRLGAYLLDGLLLLVTLILGWLIWSLIVWKDGRTPAKQLLGMRVARKDRGTPATWGTMCLRELVGKGLVMGVLSFVSFGIAPLVLFFMLLWDRDRQELWDKIAGTLVVDDPTPAVTVAPVA